MRISGVEYKELKERRKSKDKKNVFDFDWSEYTYTMDIFQNGKLVCKYNCEDTEECYKMIDAHMNKKS